MIIAPALSVALTWLFIILRQQAEFYLAGRNRRLAFEAIIAKICEALENPLTSEEHKARMREELEQVEKLRIEAACEHLQFALKEIDMASDRAT